MLFHFIWSWFALNFINSIWASDVLLIEHSSLFNLFWMILHIVHRLAFSFQSIIIIIMNNLRSSIEYRVWREWIYGLCAMCYVLCATYLVFSVWCDSHSRHECNKQPALDCTLCTCTQCKAALHRTYVKNVRKVIHRECE